jgi:hypothetical protein
VSLGAIYEKGIKVFIAKGRKSCPKITSVIKLMTI